MTTQTLSSWGRLSECGTSSQVDPFSARELALEIMAASGSTIVLNDLVGNIHDPKGVGGWFLRFMNFAGDEPHIPKPVKWKLIRDKSALKNQLLHWAEMPQLERIIVSDGSIIDGNPSHVLRSLASSLS